MTFAAPPSPAVQVPWPAHMGNPEWVTHTKGFCETDGVNGKAKVSQRAVQNVATLVAW